SRELDILSTKEIIIATLPGLPPAYLVYPAVQAAYENGLLIDLDLDTSCALVANALEIS
ncbi:hypothetical protein Tco_1546844, partial [Tanacetum coccineum]